MELASVLPSLTEYVKRQSGDFPDSLEKIIVFGSYARGEAKVGSDIDIALVSNGTWSIPDRGAVRDVLDDFAPELRLGLFYTTNEGLLAEDDRNTNYWIRNEGVELWRR